MSVHSLRMDISDLVTHSSCTLFRLLSIHASFEVNPHPGIRSFEIMIFSLSIFTLLSVVAAAFAQTGLEIASYFRKHLSADSAVFLPSEINYTLLTTQRFNTFSGPTYVVSVKPTTDLDVQKIVSLFDPSKSQFG